MLRADVGLLTGLAFTGPRALSDERPRQQNDVCRSSPQTWPARPAQTAHVRAPRAAEAGAAVSSCERSSAPVAAPHRSGSSAADGLRPASRPGTALAMRG